MAIAKDHAYDHLRGKVKHTLVVKHYADKIVLSACPDMSKVVATAKQKKANQAFGQFAKKASAILKDPIAKQAALMRLNCQPNKLYHLLLKELIQA